MISVRFSSGSKSTSRFRGILPAVKVALFAVPMALQCAVGGVAANAAGTPAAKPSAPASAETQACVPAAKARHVVLIGLDGFGGYAWEKAEMPRLKTLASSGAFTLKARAVLPSVSRPNWATHLMGAGPDLHGWTGNIPKPSPAPLVANERGLFPGIFPLIREFQPNAVTAAFYDWNSIHEIIDTKTITHEVYVQHGENSVTRYANPGEVKTKPKPPSASIPPVVKAAKSEKPAGGGKTKRTPEEDEHLIALYELSATEVAKAAAECIVEKKPVFSFVYLGSADESGHIAGHNTPRYYETLRKLDIEIARVLDAIKAAGIADETTVIVVSDHGGINKGHGGKSLLEVQTPWIIAGAGVRKGVALKSAIVHTDTSPTIARLLGLPEPQPWRGKPALEALEK